MRIGAIVIDSDEVETLSTFYEALLGWTKHEQVQNGEKWITLVKSDYSEVPIVFQENMDYVRPVWPPIKEEQQHMLHLDFYVRMDSYEDKIKHAIDCGATFVENQSTDDWKVLLDPSGHPFCIIPIPNDLYDQRYC